MLRIPSRQYTLAALVLAVLTCLPSLGSAQRMADLRAGPSAVRSELAAVPLDLARPPRLRNHIVAGAVIGAALGLLVGAMTIGDQGNDAWFPKELLVAEAGVAGALGGGVVGGIVYVIRR